jgi:DNA topoisomerase-3
MRLIIAEKPSLARAIADVLPPPHRRQDGYIECGGDVVTWCAGHILELADADEYAPEYRTWSMDHLPITPATWKHVPKAADLLKTIKKLLRQADRVVHAGDPDREGQLLVDEVLEYFEYRGPVDRLLVSDLNPPAVRRALAEIKSNDNFRALSLAARGRQRADWLYGINLTRLYTLLGRAGGYDGVLSVGRVQTPLLGIVVRRDLEIEHFKPTPYFVITADLATDNCSCSATWIPGDAVAPHLDVEGRLVSRDVAAAVERRTTGVAGVVTKCTHEKKSEAPPLPYSLADLQIDAGRRMGLGPKQVLDACQALYETHRLTTYPRSDCAYLPEAHLEHAAEVIAAVTANLPSLGSAAAAAHVQLRSRAWDDRKITAHHAIIPTPLRRPDAALNDAERGIYDLICRRYLAQFYPGFEFNQSVLDVLIADERFTARGRQPLRPGWRALYTSNPTPDGDDDQDIADEQAILPLVEEGARVSATSVSVVDKQTSPPKRFTEASLVQAMTGVARFVSDPKVKKLLQETDGIGTPATQAGIIETLFERGFVEKRRRQIVSTPIARLLVQALPAVATTPDLTAYWEAAMRKIADGQMPLDAFLAGVRKQLTELVSAGRSLGVLSIPGATRLCTRSGCSGTMRLRQGSHGRFWSCSRYPECRQAEQASDAGGDGVPAPAVEGPRRRGQRG